MTPRKRYGQAAAEPMRAGARPGRRHRRMRRGSAPGTLASLRTGDSAIIERIDDDRARAQALRFGMGEGASVSCITAIPAGPVILRSGRQEIAVGRGLACRIHVRSEVA